MTELRLDLPAEVVGLLGPTKDAAAGRARQAVVLDLLREGSISQGKAARLLGITRHDVLDLMAKYEIPSGPRTIEELEQELDVARTFLRARDTADGPSR